MLCSHLPLLLSTQAWALSDCGVCLQVCCCAACHLCFRTSAVTSSWWILLRDAAAAACAAASDWTAEGRGLVDSTVTHCKYYNEAASYQAQQRRNPIYKEANIVSDNVRNLLQNLRTKPLSTAVPAICISLRTPGSHASHLMSHSKPVVTLYIQTCFSIAA